MDTRTIVILGGYGNTGRALARLLLDHSDFHLVLAGRDAGKAEREAARWDATYPGRTRGAAADAADGGSLRRLFHGADFVVVASSTSPHARTVVEAALAAGVDLMDPQFSRAKLTVLRELAPRIESAGRCVITDGGFHPGMPALLVRYAAGRLEQLRSARVGSVIQIDWRGLSFSPGTLDELVEELRDFQMMHYRQGGWRGMGWLESLRPVWMNFDHGFGRRTTAPMFLEEMRPLPDLIPGLEETGFFVGGFNWFVDYIVMPAGLVWLRLSPRSGRAVGRVLEWALRRFSRPPFGTLLRLEAHGVRGGVASDLVVNVYHRDGYVLTAAPMAACLLQVLDGSARRPGLHFQALLADPARLLSDLQRMGVEVAIDFSPP